MGFIGSMFSNDKGAGYQGSYATDIQNPASVDQANTIYSQQQAGIGDQQNFIAALQAQNGIGNQANVFGQQQALANQLQAQTQGQGPNPAQIQLANATGQNINQQAALMGSQRGASQNVGMMARQAGQQGAGIQQQAVGQSALLQAQQQLAAQQQLQQQQGMMGNLAGAQIGQQQNALTGYQQALGSQQQNILGAIARQNAERVAMQSNINSANAHVAGANQSSQSNALSGLAGGLGQGIAGMFTKGGGGATPGGVTGGNPSEAPGGGQPDGGSGVGLGGSNMPTPVTGGGGSGYSPGQGGVGGLDPNASFTDEIRDYAHGGTIHPAHEPQSKVGRHLSGHSLQGEAYAKGGMKVPGKASVPGDSYANDTVNAKLSPGEIIIPRSHANDPDKAAAFARAVVLKNRKK